MSPTGPDMAVIPRESPPCAFEKVTDAVSYARPGFRARRALSPLGRWTGLDLAPISSAMRRLWLIPVSMMAVAAGYVLRMRRRRQLDVALITGSVSADWLAHARGREEQEW